MKVAVMGAGAIGAYAGAALHRAGAEVHLIARGPHLAAVRRDGVRVLSPRGDFTARPAATDDPASVGPVDYVFLGLKANSCAASGPLVHPLLHDRTAVIAAQNGIPWWYFHGLPGPYTGRRIESADPGGAVSATLPPERAIGCVVYAATELESPGVVRHLEGTRFSIGEPDLTVSRRCLDFSEAMVAGAQVPRRARPAQRQGRSDEDSRTEAVRRARARRSARDDHHRDRVARDHRSMSLPVQENEVVKGRFGFQHVQNRN